MFLWDMVTLYASANWQIVYMDKEILDKIQKDKQELLCGEYSLWRYDWILKEVEVIDEPIHAKGHLNIWNCEADEW